jgi:hypothetical protein
MKWADYVEGKAEQLFVADILEKYSSCNPAAVGFRCITLNADNWEPIPYPSQGTKASSSSCATTSEPPSRLRDASPLVFAPAGDEI